eukprot:TRINITY_DN497_c0_g1_i1.p2 TRINITY_DN497_c0_g1~~TRINITY_DN497_c0_g1_i1.p2  ORF type:complete len:307 (+),score=86.43 TRINITY_DN497_c0_g1_i1:83-922(+)
MAAGETTDEERLNLDYIRKHDVHRVFEHLADELLKKRPEDPIRFLQAVLDGMKPPAASERLKIDLVVFGLDNAGKTTLISALGGKGIETAPQPTVGFTPTRLRGEKYEDDDVQLYDLGGGKKFRGIWPQYFADVHGIVYVVDASDPERFEESRECLNSVLQHPRCAGKPLLLFGNKQDHSGARTAADLRSAFNISAYQGAHNVFTCCALRPDHAQHANVDKGIEWLLLEIARQYPDLSARVKREIADQRVQQLLEKEEKGRRVVTYIEERERPQVGKEQ